MITSLWLGVVLLCLITYVVLDGYDLGAGIAALFERDAGHRRHLLESVAVGWDGNETWLILLGVSVWAGFPLAFGTLLPQLYLPLVVVLFSLIVRGVAVEMASQSPPAPGWTRAFGVASLTAALGQGFALGELASRLPTHADSAFGAFSWFAALCALTVAAAYTALGYAYARQKSSGALRRAAGRRGATATALATLLAALTLVAAPLDLHSPGRSFAFAGLLIFAAAGVSTALVGFRRSVDDLPLAGLATATLAGLLALVVARYPLIAPPNLTLSAAVAPHTTMVFLLVGIGLNIPLVLAYNLFAHRAFTGKLQAPPVETPVPGASA